MNLRLLISMIGSHFPCTYIPVTSARHDSGLRGGEVDRGERPSPGAAAPNFRHHQRVRFITKLSTGSFAVSSDARTASGIAVATTMPLIGRFLRQNTNENSGNEVIVVIRPRLLTPSPGDDFTRPVRVGSEEAALHSAVARKKANIPRGNSMAAGTRHIPHLVTVCAAPPGTGATAIHPPALLPAAPSASHPCRLLGSLARACR